MSRLAIPGPMAVALVALAAAIMALATVLAMPRDSGIDADAFAALTEDVRGLSDITAEVDAEHDRWMCAIVARTGIAPPPDMPRVCPDFGSANAGLRGIDASLLTRAEGLLAIRDLLADIAAEVRDLGTLANGWHEMRAIAR